MLIKCTVQYRNLFTIPMKWNGWIFKDSEGKMKHRHFEVNH